MEICQDLDIVGDWPSKGDRALGKVGHVECPGLETVIGHLDIGVSLVVARHILQAQKILQAEASQRAVLCRNGAGQRCDDQHAAALYPAVQSICQLIGDVTLVGQDEHFELVQPLEKGLLVQPEVGYPTLGEGAMETSGAVLVDVKGGLVGADVARCRTQGGDIGDGLGPLEERFTLLDKSHCLAQLIEHGLLDVIAFVHLVANPGEPAVGDDRGRLLLHGHRWFAAPIPPPLQKGGAHDIERPPLRGPIAGQVGAVEGLIVRKDVGHQRVHAVWHELGLAHGIGPVKGDVHLGPVPVDLLRDGAPHDIIGPEFPLDVQRPVRVSVILGEQAARCLRKALLAVLAKAVLVGEGHVKEHAVQIIVGDQLRDARQHPLLQRRAKDAHAIVAGRAVRLALDPLWVGGGHWLAVENVIVADASHATLVQSLQLPFQHMYAVWKVGVQIPEGAPLSKRIASAALDKDRDSLNVSVLQPLGPTLGIKTLRQANDRRATVKVKEQLAVARAVPGHSTSCQRQIVLQSVSHPVRC